MPKERKRKRVNLSINLAEEKKNLMKKKLTPREIKSAIRKEKTLYCNIPKIDSKSSASFLATKIEVESVFNNTPLKRSISISIGGLTNFIISSLLFKYMVKMFQKEIKIKTKGLYDFVRITEELEKCVKESKIKSGILFANLLHNTAALLIQEDDESIFEDLKEMFERILPMKEKYHHSYEGNVNATAHQKNNLLKSFFTAPIKDGKLVKGTWQDFWVVELFEPRERTVFVTIIGE